jgi:hypothetical protein
MSRRALFVTLSLSLSVGWAPIALTPRVALAQSAEVKAQAQKKAREGQKLADKGQHDKALALFKEAYDLLQEPGYLYNMGIEYQALGRDVDAYDAFDRFLKDVQKIPPEFIADANQQQRELRKRLGEVEVRCTQEGARISVDDRDTAQTPTDAPIRVPAGAHRLSVRKEGFETFQTSIEVSGGAKLKIEALMRPIPLKGGASSVAAKGATPAGPMTPAAAVDTSAPGQPGPTSLQGVFPEQPQPAVSPSGKERPPLHLSLSGGVGIWADGVPNNPDPTGAFALGAGYRVVKLSKDVEFKAGAKVGLSFIAEPGGRDVFVSALANPMVVFNVVPDRVFIYGEVGLGVLVISGVSQGSVLLQPGSGNVTGALGTFELRPGVGAAYSISPAFSVFLSPTVAWSPSPSSAFVYPSIVQVEIAAGAMAHL